MPEAREKRDAAFSKDAVRSHYARLAPEYRRRANRACTRAYRDLARRHLSGARRILELGAGAEPLLAAAGGGFQAACDLSLDMLAGAGAEFVRFVADAGHLPVRDAAFDAVLAVNLLEHVPEPDRILSETARVLVPGGRALIVTPNGDRERLLDMLETLRLKLPEGPHRFLRPSELAAMVPDAFHILEHRSFLALPAGPLGFIRFMDRLCGRCGLFQYLLLKIRDSNQLLRWRTGRVCKY